MTKTLACLLIFNLLLITSTYGQTGVDTRIEKARQEATKLSGGNKKASVKMKSGEKYKGRITAVSQDTFTFVKSDGGTTEVIAFADVEQIKKSGGLGTGAWIAIGATAVVAVVLASFLRKRICNESAC